jgi:hypothetical protein
VLPVRQILEETVSEFHDVCRALGRFG